MSRGTTGRAVDRAGGLLLLDQIDGRIARVTADGAYYGAPTYQTIATHGETIEVVIPSRSTAVPGGELGPSHSVIAIWRSSRNGDDWPGKSPPTMVNDRWSKRQRAATSR
jgi:hypothetical protein